MTAPKKPTNNSGRNSGADSGAGSGDRSGREPAQELEDLLPELLQLTATLQDSVKVYAGDSDGRVPGGARLGSIPLHPPLSLDDRVIAEWGGPRVYWLQFRGFDGAIVRWARLRVGAAAPGRTSTAAMPPAMAAAAPVAAAAPQQPGLLDTLRDLRELGLLQAPGASAPVPPQTIPEQVKAMTAGIEALEAAGLATKKRDGESSTAVLLFREGVPIAKDILGQVFAAIDMLGTSRAAASNAMTAEANARTAEANARMMQMAKEQTATPTPEVK